MSTIPFCPCCGMYASSISAHLPPCPQHEIERLRAQVEAARKIIFYFWDAGCACDDPEKHDDPECRFMSAYQWLNDDREQREAKP